MRPILLAGHERSLTQIKYNTEGDLLFSCSKDHIINVWYSHNGERLGTYKGHNGTVWTVDVDSTSSYLLSGSADNTMKLWDVRTGVCLHTWDFPTAVKRVDWSEDDSRILAVTEERMGYSGCIRIFEVNRRTAESSEEPKQNTEPITTITNAGSLKTKANVAAFTSLDTYIIAGHENGTISLWDANMKGEIGGEDMDGMITENTNVHTEQVTDIQISNDGSWCVTSSKDKTAKILDVNTLDIVKNFVTETPLNSAAIVPNKPYIIVGGGQEAMNVTTTSARQGHFEVRFWHRVFEEENARVKAGFGPCNTLAVEPHGTGYAVGGEDGYVRIHHFDEDFLRSKPYGAEMEPEED